MKAVLLRTYVAMLCSGAANYDSGGEKDQPADGYMTLAGYFNALRELGAMRRLVEDNARNLCALRDSTPAAQYDRHPWYVARRLEGAPVELTSRETTGNISATRSRLHQPYGSSDKVDVLLASNMISVGIDIDRLGLMVVAGQPKSTSEYIQATSRVGRNKQWPGLVLTCLNLHKPRDRSHYERFTAYHESFYRHVEATSLTPFSGPALKRGLDGALIAMMRLLEEDMTPSRAAMRIDQDTAELQNRVIALLKERGASQPGDYAMIEKLADEIEALARNTLDRWKNMVAISRKGGAFATILLGIAVIEAPLLCWRMRWKEMSTIHRKRVKNSWCQLRCATWNRTFISGSIVGPWEADLMVRQK